MPIHSREFAKRRIDQGVFATYTINGDLLQTWMTERAMLIASTAEPLGISKRIVSNFSRMNTAESIIFRLLLQGASSGMASVLEQLEKAGVLGADENADDAAPAKNQPKPKI